MSSNSASVRSHLINLLSLREHSQKELVDKLAAKSFDALLIEQEIKSLQEIGLQCDSRFAESFIRMRVRQGKGPLIIQQELSSKGISKDVATAAFDEINANWAELASDVRRRKFGDEPPVDAKSKAKQLRFLAGRGFASSQAFAALSAQQFHD